MLQKIIFVFLLLSTYLISSSQIVEKASLMKIKDPYGEANRPHTYKALKNGSKFLSGRIGYSIQYTNWTITNGDSLPPNLRYYIALFNNSDSLLWVKYTNGYVQTVETDSKNNIYLTGSYKSKLHTSDGDTLSLLSNTIHDYGNIFIMKLDSAGNRKWWRTTDHEDVSQFEPYGDYIKVDPDFNVYISGHYDYFIRFNSQISFSRNSSNLGFIPFLAKLDSNGNYKWVRDWNIDSGLPCGLSIDSCRINMFTILGASQTNIRLRKFDFSGRLLEQKSMPNSSGELFWSNGVNVKNNRIIMSSLEGSEKKINYYNMDGTRIWSINHTTHIVSLQFTNQNKIFFFGLAPTDTNRIGTTIVPKGIFFGEIDTMGNILRMRGIPNVSYSGLPHLAPDGRLYINSVLDYYSNNNSSTYTLDTVTFNNLTYYDPGTGIISGIYYRLLAQFNLTGGTYFSPGNCTFSPSLDTCLNREGLFNCTPGIFNLTVIPECNGVVNRIRLSWTTSSYATNFDIYRGGSLYSGGNLGTQFIDTAITAGNSYTYSVKANNSAGSTNNSNGTLSATAPNCTVTSVIDPTNNPFEIKVFPNPSNGEYYLTAKRVKNKIVIIDIINALGQVLYSTEQKSLSNNYSKKINIINAANGLFFLKITIDKKAYLITVVKQ